MANGLLKDVAASSPEFKSLDPEKNENMIVGRDKVSGQKKRVCKNLSEQPLKPTCAISFDGKHSKSLCREGFGDKQGRNVKQSKEVIVVTDMENKEFIGEFRADSGKGNIVGQGVIDKVHKKKLSMKDVKMLGGDSTSSVTGFKDGAFSWIEEFAGKAFHWIVCTSHLVELPLRKLCQIKIGSTSGPGSFKSALGVKIQSITSIPAPVAFQKITCADFPIIEGRACLFTRLNTRLPKLRTGGQGQ